MKSVYGVAVHISKRRYGEFRVFEEEELRPRGISPAEYASTIASLLRRWVQSKKLNVVPVGVFLGDWALNRFIKISNTTYVDVKDNDSEALLYYELLVARLFIERGGSVPLKTIVAELSSFLSSEWMDAYINKTRPVYEALDVLCEEYGVRSAHTYFDIIDRRGV